MAHLGCLHTPFVFPTFGLVEHDWSASWSVSTKHSFSSEITINEAISVLGMMSGGKPVSCRAEVPTAYIVDMFFTVYVCAFCGRPSHPSHKSGGPRRPGRPRCGIPLATICFWHYLIRRDCDPAEPTHSTRLPLRFHFSIDAEADRDGIFVGSGDAV